MTQQHGKGKRRTVAVPIRVTIETLFHTDDLMESENQGTKRGIKSLRTRAQEVPVQIITTAL